MKLKFEYLNKTSLKPEASEFLRTTRSHHEISKYLFEDKKISRIEQENFYKAYCADLDRIIYLAKDDNLYIGYCTFHINIKHHRCEVGYVIHPDFWSKGYGSQMVKWSIKQVQKESESYIKRLYLEVFVWNESAIKLYEKCGFEREGIMRSYVYKAGKFEDVLLMSQLIE